MLELHARGEWGAMGPDLITRVLRDQRTADEGETCALEQAAFYSIAPPEMAAYFAPWVPSRDARRWEDLHARSVSVHFWNALTRDVPLACGSLMHRLFEENCVACVPLPCVTDTLGLNAQRVPP
jgi:hypothetical protein